MRRLLLNPNKPSTIMNMIMECSVYPAKSRKGGAGSSRPDFRDIEMDSVIAKPSLDLHS